MELVIKDSPDPVGDLIRQLEMAGEWDLVDAIRNHMTSREFVAVSLQTLEDLAEECDDLTYDLGFGLGSGDSWTLEDEAHSVRSSLVNMRERLRRLTDGK